MLYLIMNKTWACLIPGSPSVPKMEGRRPSVPKMEAMRPSVSETEGMRPSVSETEGRRVCQWGGRDGGAAILFDDVPSVEFMFHVSFWCCTFGKVNVLCVFLTMYLRWNSCSLYLLACRWELRGRSRYLLCLRDGFRTLINCLCWVSSSTKQQTQSLFQPKTFRNTCLLSAKNRCPRHREFQQQYPLGEVGQKPWS